MSKRPVDSPATVVGLTFVSFQTEGRRLGQGALLGVYFFSIFGIAGPQERSSGPYRTSRALVNGKGPAPCPVQTVSPL
jgi:hypothetical protein